MRKLCPCSGGCEFLIKESVFRYSTTVEVSIVLKYLLWGGGGRLPQQSFSRGLYKVSFSLQSVHSGIVLNFPSQENIPMVSILCNPGIRARHWEQMSAIVCYDLTPNSGTTLRKVLRLNLTPYLEQFEAISAGASKVRPAWGWGEGDSTAHSTDFSFSTPQAY